MYFKEVDLFLFEESPKSTKTCIIKYLFTKCLYIIKSLIPWKQQKYQPTYTSEVLNKPDSGMETIKVYTNRDIFFTILLRTYFGANLTINLRTAPDNTLFRRQTLSSTWKETSLFRRFYTLAFLWYSLWSFLLTSSNMSVRADI